MHELIDARDAHLSTCLLYRYSLWRRMRIEGARRVFVWVGVNPSTADALVDDQTVKKVAGFTSRAGGTEFYIVNLFAFRAKDVTELRTALDPVGPLTDLHLSRVLARADVVVPCWGNRGKLPRALHPRLEGVVQRMDARAAAGYDVRCLGRTKTGDPGHPQMPGYDTPLIRWKEAA